MRTNLKMMAAVVAMGMMIASCGNEFQPTLPHGERLSPSIYLIFN